MVYGFYRMALFNSQTRRHMIMDNSDKVGQNCLTYMDSINDMSTRSMIYNKMVQMLECKGVCDTIGCHSCFVMRGTL